MPYLRRLGSDVVEVADVMNQQVADKAKYQAGMYGGLGVVTPELNPKDNPYLNGLGELGCCGGSILGLLLLAGLGGGAYYYFMVHKKKAAAARRRRLARRRNKR